MKKFLFLSALAALPVYAAVVVPAIFSDHAVLARREKVPVFGKAAPGEKVVVSFNNQQRETVAGMNGKWRVDLNLADSPEGPFELKINNIVIKDVIVGEVWFCSGQSNMQWGMKTSEGYKEACANPPGSRLRSFIIRNASREFPVDTVNGKWVYADAGNIGAFSGVAYFFGSKLLRELNRPVGLIKSSWGGSPIEAWMTRDAAKVVPAVAKRDEAVSARLKIYPRLLAEYVSAIGKWAKENKRPDSEVKFPPAGAVWKKMPVCKISGGIFWMRTGITTDKKVMNFLLPRQKAPFMVWIDGKKVFEFGWDKVAAGVVPDFTLNDLSDGEHEVIFRFYNPVSNNAVFNTNHYTFAGKVFDFYAEKIFTNKTTVPPRGIGSRPREFFNTQRLFNGCVYPMLPYAVSGVIWYQGETNAGRFNEYAALKQALIKDWRKQFENPALPFFWCSLAGFRQKNANPNREEQWAYLRAAQRAGLELPMTGEAILIDVSESEDIHPRNKVVPGERLAAIALAKVHGKKVPFAGPEMTRIVPENGKLRIFFKNVGGGLVARPVPDFYYVIKASNRKAPLKRNAPGTQLEGFAVCGKDGKWFWADFAVIDGDTVVVASKKVESPVGVRYAWQNNPTCNLFNKDGFPAVPFMSK